MRTEFPPFFWREERAVREQAQPFQVADGGIRVERAVGRAQQDFAVACHDEEFAAGQDVLCDDVGIVLATCGCLALRDADLVAASAAAEVARRVIADGHRARRCFDLGIRTREAVNFRFRAPDEKRAHVRKAERIRPIHRREAQDTVER